MALKNVVRFFLVLIHVSSCLGRSGKMFSPGFVSLSESLPSWPILSAGISVTASLVLSLFLIFEHLCAYHQPEEQKFLIGLILMVPVYAVQSFFSLLNSNVAFICELMRDCYEAFAMYCFERYLIACLGGEESTIRFMEGRFQISESSPLLDLDYDYGIVKHPFPLNWFMRNWYLGPDFYHAVKVGIVQYMILKPICAILAIFMQLIGIYGEGKFAWRYGYPYLAIVLNFSQTWALYCLIQFYTATKEKLEPIKPLSKFLTFKSIVFLTWWQGIAVAFLFSTGLFKGHLAQRFQTRIQDYIICLEMGVAAVVHLKVFPAKPYRRGERSVSNVAVMSDYASLGAPDPEEEQEIDNVAIMQAARPDARDRRLSFPQSVRDVVLGSGEIMVDDVKYTVSHVVEPVERSFSKINRTLHQISENVKQLEKQKKKAKDDSDVPLEPFSEEFAEAHDNVFGGSVSDSGFAGKRHKNAKRAPSSLKPFDFRLGRWF
ncbi:protein LAZ1 homolog 1 [Oryza brachyantha]|uniref:Protein LAZ1 homolog 1 n=1 Tax=Oryza brachyantha TaxID=4533 RepID=J3M8W6_ORYBR|nr:protein LAZ1 homolog 1 [Oryza brachyantha]XP_040380387.1 protein LAZ1 homolog 1 [Oryza brachyantha]